MIWHSQLLMKTMIKGQVLVLVVQGMVVLGVLVALVLEMVEMAVETVLETSVVVHRGVEVVKVGFLASNVANPVILLAIVLKAAQVVAIHGPLLVVEAAVIACLVLAFSRGSSRES